MKKLKGHKPACKCVGCSAATRARGMKALGLTKKAPKSHSKRRGMMRAAVKKLGDMKKYPNPLTRKEAIAEIKYARYLLEHGKKRSDEKSRAYYFGRAEGHVSAVTHNSKIRQVQRVTKKMAERVGKALYSNPAKHGPFIGVNPTLRFDTGRAIRYPGKMYAGKDGSSVVIFSPHSANIVHHQVRAVEYDNKAKAMRAYGRPGRFLHTFKTPVSVKSPGSGIIVLKSSSRIWRTQ